MNIVEIKKFIEMFKQESPQMKIVLSIAMVILGIIFFLWAKFVIGLDSRAREDIVNTQTLFERISVAVEKKINMDYPSYNVIRLNKKSTNHIRIYNSNELINAEFLKEEDMILNNKKCNSDIYIYNNDMNKDIYYYISVNCDGINYYLEGFNKE